MAGNTCLEIKVLQNPFSKPFATITNALEK